MEINRNRTVVIIGIRRQYKQMNKPYFVRGVYSVSNNRYITGLDVLEEESEAKRLKEMFSIDPMHSMFPIKDGERLNLINDEHFIKYLFCLITPEIAKNRREVISSVHLFYLHDAVEEAEIDNQKHKIIFDAVSYIAGLSEKEIMNIAMYLGVNVREQSPAVIRSNISKISLEEPERIMKFKSMPNTERQVFVAKLFMYDVLHPTNSGIYFKDQYIGATKEEVISILFDDKSKALLARLNIAVEAVENPMSKSATVVAKDIVNIEFESELKKKDIENELLKQKFEYYKLTNTEYSGEDTTDAILASIALYNDKMDKVSKFKSDFAKKDIAALKKSASMRKIPEEQWMNTEDIESIREVIIKSIME